MGVFGRLFGSDKHISKGMGMIDDAFYTKQEQATDDLKRTQFKMAFMKLYEPYKLAQRVLAMIFGIPFVLIHLVVAANWITVIWIIESAERYKFMVAQFKFIVELNNQTLGEPMAIILAFYFLGGVAEGAISKLMAGRRSKEAK